MTRGCLEIRSINESFMRLNVAVKDICDESGGFFLTAVTQKNRRYHWLFFGGKEVSLYVSAQCLLLTVVLEYESCWTQGQSSETRTPTSPFSSLSKEVLDNVSVHTVCSESMKRSQKISVKFKMIWLHNHLWCSSSFTKLAVVALEALDEPKTINKGLTFLKRNGKKALLFSLRY